MRTIAAALALLSALAAPALAQPRLPGNAPPAIDMMAGAGIEVIPLPERNLLVLVDQRSRQVALCRFTAPPETATVPGYACTQGFSPFPR